MLQASAVPAPTHHALLQHPRGRSTHLLRLLVELLLQLVDLTLLHSFLGQHVVNTAGLQRAQRVGWAIE